MKIGILGDIHLKVKESVGKNNVLLEDKLENIKFFVDTCLEQKVDEVFLLGDIFHNMNPPQWLRDMFLDSISPLIGVVPMYIILGNHDMNRNSINLHKEIEVFGRTNQIKFIVDTYHHPKVPVFMAGYGVKEMDLRPAKILITHAGIDKGLVGFYDRPLNDYTYLEEDLSQYELVIAGHFHKPQEYSLGKTTIIYPGSIAPIDFAERDEDKNFLILEINNSKVEIEPYPFPKKREFIQVMLSQDSDLYDSINAIDKEKYFGAIVKLVYLGDSIWYDGINHLELYEYLFEELNVNDVAIERKIKDIEAVSFEIQQDATDVEIIQSFGEEKELDQPIIDVGIKLFTQAKEEEE